MVRFDCQACGACCCNTARNRAAGTREYVEVTREDRLFREDRERFRALTVRGEDGRSFMKLVGAEQRCIALEGELAAGVGCAIYALRPAGCRQVESGDEECLNARRLFGLPLTVREDRERIARLDDASPESQ